jgi:hypothetical protein
VTTTPIRARRPCPRCGNPTATAALLEAHFGTRRLPRADVVVWLCPACALPVTSPGRGRAGPGGRP